MDPIEDYEMVQTEFLIIHEACIRSLVLCMISLKEVATFGLCLDKISEMMSREEEEEVEDKGAEEVNTRQLRGGGERRRGGRGGNRQRKWRR